MFTIAVIVHLGYYRYYIYNKYSVVGGCPSTEDVLSKRTVFEMVIIYRLLILSHVIAPKWWWRNFDVEPVEMSQDADTS